MRLSILNLSKSTRNTKKSATKLNNSLRAHIPSHYLKTVLYSVEIKIFPSKIHTFFLIEKKGGSPCFFKRKRAFVSMSSSAWGKSLTLSTRKRWCARANDEKIVRSKDSQCNTFFIEESPQVAENSFPALFSMRLSSHNKCNNKHGFDTAIILFAQCQRYVIFLHNSNSVLMVLVL